MATGCDWNGLKLVEDWYGKVGLRANRLTCTGYRCYVAASYKIMGVAMIFNTHQRHSVFFGTLTFIHFDQTLTSYMLSKVRFATPQTSSACTENGEDGTNMQSLAEPWLCVGPIITPSCLAVELPKATNEFEASSVLFTSTTLHNIPLHL